MTTKNDTVRPNKRPWPIEAVADDDEILLALMTKGNHEDEDDDDEKEALQRREARRQDRRNRTRQDESSATTIPFQQAPDAVSPPLTSEELLRQQSVAVIQSTTTHTNNNNVEVVNIDNTNKNDDNDDDEFDMFSSSVSPVVTNKSTTTQAGMAGDYQDYEGYYKAVMGETLDLANAHFTVLGVVGKGVFSTVLQCSTSSSTTLPSTVALKLIRHNEIMSKTAQAEVRFLVTLSNHPHIVPLLVPDAVEHRGHVVLIFPYVRYNLRDVLQKFGKGVGLSLTAVASYFGQFLSALHHLEAHRIIHADLKPDNILVSHDFTTCLLCDFGSATEVGSALPTPYMVSRYYRAPELILGAIPTPAIDLWSIAVTVAELFIGQVLFSGQSNNDMIFEFMNKLGPISNKTIRQHFVSMTKHAGIVAQFVTTPGAQYQFLQSSVDPVTGNPIVRPLSLHQFPTLPFQSLLLSSSKSDSRPLVLLLSQLLHKCLALDASRRISVKAAMTHEFFVAIQTAAAVVAEQQQQQHVESMTLD